MSTADFKITGSTSGESLQAAGGHDAVNGETLTLALEASPGLDIQSARFELVVRSEDEATEIALSNGGVPTPTPLDGVTVAMPAAPEVSSWHIRCTINDGSQDGWVKERIVSIRSGKGLRKMCPSEQTQYDTTYGWIAAYNQLVDYLETLNIISGGLVDDDLEVTGDLVVDGFLTSAVPVSVFSTTGADMNDVPVTGTTFHVEIDEAGGDLTGFAGMADGQLLIVSVVSGSGGFVLKHEDSRSTAANRLVHPGGRDVVMVAGMTVVYQHAVGRLRLLGANLPAFGQLFISASATTTISVTNDWYKIAGTTTLTTDPAAADFSMSADNRLLYGGAGALVQVKLDLAMTGFSAFAGEIALAKNGNVITDSIMGAQVATAKSPCSTSALVSLVDGDYIEAFVRNTSNTANVAVNNLVMAAVKIA